MNNCFFISEGAFTFKVEGTGVITWGFFVSGGSEVIIVVSINEKTLIHKNILPTDPNKKIKLIIYYNKFKTLNLQ